MKAHKPKIELKGIFLEKHLCFFWEIGLRPSSTFIYYLFLGDTRGKAVEV